MISPAADWREQQTFVSAPSLGTDNGTLHRQLMKTSASSNNSVARKTVRHTNGTRCCPAICRKWSAIWRRGKSMSTPSLCNASSGCLTLSSLTWPWPMPAPPSNRQPSPFRRPLCVFAADTIYQWAERQFEARQPIDPYFAIVLSHMRSDWRLPEALCARYCKLAGQYVLSQAADNGLPSHIHDRQTLETALKLFEMAHQEYPKIGVKTLITRIQMRLNALNNQ